MDLQEQAGGRIRYLRGWRVLLDRDLAELYGVEVGALNRAVSRNRERFPPDFMFRLTFEECSRCQSGILKRGQNIKYLPHAFTEQGVAMLSGVLRSKQAVRVNVAIMRAFVRLREAVEAHAELGRRLSEVECTLADHGERLGQHAERIREGLEAVRRLMEGPEPSKKRIGSQNS